LPETKSGVFVNIVNIILTYYRVAYCQCEGLR